MNNYSDLYGKNWFAPLVLFGFTLFAHGCLLLADFVIVDGWWMLDWLNHKDWDAIKDISTKKGLYFERYFFGIFLLFPEPNIAVKVFTFINLYLIAVIIYLISGQTSWFSKKECLFISIVSLTLPTVRVFGNTYPFMMYLSAYLIFLFCVYTTFSIGPKIAYRHIVIRMVSLGGFFVSFTFGSLLVFYFGFLVVLMCYEKRNGKYCTSRFMYSWLIGRLDYLLLPFVFWIWRRTMFPGVGEHLTYQQPFLQAILDIPVQFVRMVAYIIPGQVVGGISLLFSFATVGVLAVCLSYLVARLSWRIVQVRDEDANSVGTASLAFLTMFLLFVAVFPYWATNNTIRTDGFDTRHALLMSIPIAMLLLVVARLIPRLFSESVGSFARYFLFIFLIGSFSVVHIKTYYDWQAISVKEQSVIYNLSKLEGLKDYRLVKVQDKFILNLLYEQSWGRWSYVLKVVCGDYERYAFNTYRSLSIWKYPDKERITDHVMSSSRTTAEKASILNGKQGVMTIEPGEYIPEYVGENDKSGVQPTSEFRIGKRQKLILVGRYLYYKFFNPEVLNEYLGTLTSISLIPVSNLLSTDRD